MEKNKSIPASKKFKDRHLNKWLLFVVLLILGFVVSLQAKSIEENRRIVEARRADYDYYLNMLQAEKEYSDIISSEIERLQGRKSKLLERTLFDAGDHEILEKYNKVKNIAGFTEVTGSGIVVTLDDMSVEDPLLPATTSIIHDSDIRQVVDLMRAAGAVAISINGERVVSTSELTCNGPTVQINGNKYPVPYEIKAIGDIVLMKRMIDEDNYIQNRIHSNISFDLRIEDEISIPGFSQYDRVEHFIDSLKEVAS